MSYPENMRRQTKAVYILAGVFTALFLVVGIWFVNYAANLVNRDTAEYIQRATNHTTTEVERHISDELNMLKATAVLPDDRPLLADDMIFNRLVQRLMNYFAYARVGVADLDGKALWVDESGTAHGSFRYDPFFERAVSGEAVVTETRTNAVNGMDVNYYAVPIMGEDGETIRGVLFVAAKVDELRGIVSRSLYAGRGTAHILDSHGRFVVKSQSHHAFTMGDDIFTIHGYLDGMDWDGVRDDFTAGRRGYLEHPIFADSRLVAYEPLDYNGWMVFYAVPEAAVNARTRTLTEGVMGIIVAASFLFVLFILLIHMVNNKSRRELEHLAFVDPVTGRGNYHRFLCESSRILKENPDAGYAVCYADIIGFKYVNDLFGRDVGDRLLRYWSDLLAEMAQPGTVFARVSADSFVMLCRYQSRWDIELRMLSMSRRVALFPETAALGYRVDINSGIYLTSGCEDTLSIEDMLDRANTAQKIIKEQGIGENIGFYSTEMREKKLWETEVAAAMEHALANEEFLFYLQPKVSVTSGKIIGAEALVRWDSPLHGTVSPDRFVALFERNGFIMQLDRYIFERVCRFYRDHLLNKGLEPLVLSVNVSRLGLARQDFIATYAAIRREYGIPAGCMELEFTESLILDNCSRFQNAVSMCKIMGFRSSLDDFGAGYSSLNLLKSVRVDILKLDRQLFQYGDESERGRMLVRDIIAMAKDLGMSTVAEGIETEEQVEELRGLGCDAVQGYVYSKPMEPELFLDFVQNWKKSS